MMGRPRVAVFPGWRLTMATAMLTGLGAFAYGQPDDKGLAVRSPSATATDFGQMQKYALIIGINEYENHSQGIPSLRYAVRDARAVYEAVTDSARGGFVKDHVQMLCDDCAVQPTSANIGRALTKLLTQANEEDLVLLFFSGHGLEENGRAYLLPCNTDLDALDYTALERDAFIRQIDRLRAKKVVVILDACHAGGVSRGGKAAGKDAALSEHFYQQFSTAEGRAFVASCAGGELSWEDEA